MKISKIALAVLCIGVLSCKKEPNEVVLKESTQPEIEYSYYAPWVYVMDWRYGRTCGPGGGVCFQNEWGDIFEYWNYSSVTNDQIDDIHANESGQDLASIFMRLNAKEGGGHEVHILLTRDAHQDGEVYLENDYPLTEELSGQLGVTAVTLSAGNYLVDYSEYSSFGEVRVDCSVVE